MTNHQLIQTICYGAPHGLQVQYKNGQILKINPKNFNYDSKNEEVAIRLAIQDVEKRHAKLLLHSTSKLTEPILEGGKVPIVELFKICMKDKQVPDAFFYNYVASNIENGANLEIEDFVFGYDFTDSSFVLGLGDKILTVFNQLELFNFMFENHFNLFNLSEEYFTEKSTLKTDTSRDIGLVDMMDEETW